MSTNIQPESERTWRHQEVLLRLSPTAKLNVTGLCDTGADISLLVDQTVTKMGLWDRMVPHGHHIQGYSPMNKKYLRLLHRICPKAKEEEDFRTSKLRPLHTALVSLFRFERQTHTRVRIAYGLRRGDWIYSIGTMELQYVLRESLGAGVKESGDEIPWRTRVFDVLDTSDDSPDHGLNFDMVIGVDEGTLDELWYRERVRRRTKLPTVR